MSRLSALGRFLDRASPWIAIVFVTVGFKVLHDQGQNLHTQGQAISSGARNQIVNRAANVEAWCEGINGGRDYNRGFVEKVTRGQVKYTLGDLPCEDLIRQTLESAKHKTPITAQSNPITYRIASELGMQH